MNWNRTTVLVTGAGGFIGSHLTERLASLGAKTRAFVRYNSANSWGWLNDSALKDDIEVILGDIRDRDSLRSATKGVEVIFHLAALIAIPYSYRTPLSYTRTNVEGTVNMLQAAVDENANLFVHTSTSEAYGTAQYIPINEDHPLQGQSPYAASKIGADKMAESFHLSYGLPLAILRPFNTYGPKQSARAVIPTIITQALTESEIKLGSLEPTRDFNYIADTVEGFIRIAQSPNAIGQVVNVGSGRETSISDVATIVMSLIGKTVPIAHSSERVRPKTSEVERLCADNSKAARLLNWSPQTSLEDGIGKTIEWIQSNIERYRTGLYTI